MVPIALFCFAIAGLGLLGFNVWYCRALANARSEADAYWALARSWQETASLAVDAMERARRNHVAASNSAGRDILDRVFVME
jgi:hypothetical protein